MASTSHSHTARIQPSKVEQTPMRGKVMLVIDDDPGTLLLAEQFFNAEGFHVDTALSGEDALSRIEAIKPDVILLDLIMPGIDGYEVCRRIKQLPAFNHTPILILTAVEEVEAQQRAYELGAWDFITKRVHWPTLKYRVAYALRASTAMSTEKFAGRLLQVINQTQSEVLIFAANTLDILDANAIALKNLGYLRGELAALRFTDIIDNGADASVLEHLQTVKHREKEHFSFQMRRKNGTSFPTSGTVLYSVDDEPPVFIAVYQDIKEKKQIEDELHRLFYYDELTSLPNRRSLALTAARLMAEADRNHSRCSLFMLDLGGLSDINYNLGHAVGDSVLRQVAERLSDVVRRLDLVALNDSQTLDGSGMQLARFEGNQFTLLLADIVNPLDPASVAGRVLEALELPYFVNGTELSLTASLGIVLYPDDGTAFEELMMRAHSALHTAKKMDKSRYAFFSDEHNREAIDRFQLQAELREAITRGELELYYQPQVDNTLKRLVGAECLLRWRHPDGIRHPDTFIPLAEQTGIILEIGEWVLREAIAQLNSWVDIISGDFGLSVNISGVQLRDENFLQLTRRLLDANPDVRKHLVFELTESALIDDIERTSRWLRDVRKAGVRIAIDDFGTGYSSLSYLARLPIDYVKVDRSFTRELNANHEYNVIVLTIFQMALALGIAVIVEGVETEMQLNTLRKMGNCAIQGWLVSEALPAMDYEAFSKYFPSNN